MAQTVKNPPANAGDTGGIGLIPGLGRSPGDRTVSRSDFYHDIFLYFQMFFNKCNFYN